MLDKHLLHDVFTPNKPARLTFVERSQINETLVNALTTPGKQVVVYGHSGSGKTTLLVNKLEQLYENHVTTRCIRHLTLENLILDAFDQLDPFFSDTATISTTRSAGRSAGVDYKALKVQVSRALEEQKASTVKRFLPPTLTPQTLARLMGQANVCWVLEDFHKLEDVEKPRLAQVMKVFMDEGDKHRHLKIVALGAVDTARQVVEYDAEMRHRVAEIHVPLMSDDEIRQVITRGEALLNFKLSATVRDGTVAYTNGLAAVCHDLCLKICQAIGLVETLDRVADASDAHLEVAVQQYLREMEDTIKGVFDRALRSHTKGKFDNSELNACIIHLLSQFPQEGASEEEVLERVREREPGYGAVSLKRFLSALQTDQRGSVLRFDQASARYSFRDPIFRTVAKLRGDKSASPPTRARGALETRRVLERKQQEEFARLVQAVVSDLGWEIDLTRKSEDKTTSGGG